jgi:aminomethyltransferase
LVAAIGPRVRTSPFFDATVRAGLTSVSTYNHMWLPMSYGDPEAEYARLTEAASMWDVTAQRHIEVSGPDADEVIQRVTIVDAERVSPGTATYAPMVDHDGLLINDPILIHIGDSTWRFSIADSDVRVWIDANARSSDLRATVRELETATLAIQGPKADSVLGAAGLDRLGELRHLDHQPRKLDGIDVIVSRSGWSSQGGFELFLDDPSHAPRLWTLIEAAGREFGVGPGAPNAAERIENALLSYGTDTGYDADPFELGLGDLIDFDAAPFVGREALRSIRDRGPARRMLGAVITGGALEALGRPVPLESTAGPVGQLRAAAWSPRFGRNLGNALVEASCAVGDRATALLGGPDRLERSVEFVERPFDSEQLPPEDAAP